jgi:tellurite resistance protein TerC
LEDSATGRDSKPERFRYLHLGLAAILGFVAVKLLLSDLWHPRIVLSLAVVVASLAAAAVASAIRTETKAAA